MQAAHRGARAGCGWWGPAARYVHRVKSPAGVQSLFPDSNDLPSCGSPAARRLSLLFPRVWFESDYCAAGSENTVFPGLATLPAGDTATGLAEARLPSPGSGAWGLSVQTWGHEGWSSEAPLTASPRRDQSWLSRSTLRRREGSQVAGPACLLGSLACPSPPTGRGQGQSSSSASTPTYRSQEDLRLLPAGVDTEVAGQHSSYTGSLSRNCHQLGASPPQPLMQVAPELSCQRTPTNHGPAASRAVQWQDITQEPPGLSLNLTSAPRPPWPPSGHLRALVPTQLSRLLSLTLVPCGGWGEPETPLPAPSVFACTRLSRDRELTTCQHLPLLCQAIFSIGPSARGGEVTFPMTTPPNTHIHTARSSSGF